MSKTKGLIQLKDLRNRIVRFEKVRGADIASHVGNWRDHPENQARALAGVLREIGIADVLLCWVSERNGGKLTTFDGHLRKDMGPDVEWWCAITDLTDAEADYMLAVLDPLAGLAQADTGALDALLASVQSSESDVQQMLAELAKENGLFESKEEGGADAEPQIDRAEELRQKYGVEPSQLWRMGEHLLLCGDSTKAEDVARVMGRERAQLCVTSPPYAEQRKAQYGGVEADKYGEWWGEVQGGVKSVLSQRGSFCINIKAHSDDTRRNLYVMDLVCAMVRSHGWIYRDEFVWVHSGTPGSAEKMGKFKNCFEPIHWFTVTDDYVFQPRDVMHESDGAILVSPRNSGLERRQGKKEHLMSGAGVGHGLAFPGNVISVGKSNDIDATGGHPAAFPVGLPEFFVRVFSESGGVVYEPFAGSGTTAIACQNLGRKARMIEKDPGYCGVILERWSQVAGKQPELIT